MPGTCILCAGDANDLSAKDTFTTSSRVSILQKLSEILLESVSSLERDCPDRVPRVCQSCADLVDQFDCFQQQLEITRNGILATYTEKRRQPPPAIKKEPLEVDAETILLFSLPDDEDLEQMFRGRCCGTTFKRIDEKLDHFMSHFPSTEYQCLHDGFKTARIEEFESHLSEHGPPVKEEALKPPEILSDPDGTFRCSECPLVAASTQAGVLFHQRRTHPRKWPDFCPLCNVSVTSFMKSHLMSTHERLFIDDTELMVGTDADTFAALMDMEDETPIGSLQESLSWDLAKVKMPRGSRRRSRPGETKCFRCEEELSSWNKKITHYLTEHTPRDLKAFCCQKCDYSTNYEAGISKHMRERHEELIRDDDDKLELSEDMNGYFECSCCPVSCISELAVRFHFRKSHEFPVSSGSSRKSKRCVSCGKGFRSAGALRQHEMNAHADIKLECPLCAKTYKNTSTLKTHLKSHAEKTPQHLKLPKYVRETGLPLPECELCKQEFKTPVALAKHKQSIHGLTVAVTCKECGLEFRSPADLKTHRGEMHKTKYPCDQCEKVLFSAHSLDNHRLSFHGIGERKELNICEVCSRGFASIYHLKNHMKLHQEEAQYECKICFKKFRWASSLSCHIRAAHENSASAFQCLHCNRSFKDKNNLKKHSYTHSDQKPHSCETCGKGFIRRDLLEKHQSRCSGSAQPHPVATPSSILSASTATQDGHMNLQPHHHHGEMIVLPEALYHLN